jgi:hypothetical protein
MLSPGLRPQQSNNRRNPPTTTTQVLKSKAWLACSKNRREIPNTYQLRARQEQVARPSESSRRTRTRHQGQLGDTCQKKTSEITQIWSMKKTNFWGSAREAPATWGNGQTPNPNVAWNPSCQRTKGKKKTNHKTSQPIRLGDKTSTGSGPRGTQPPLEQAREGQKMLPSP